MSGKGQEEGQRGRGGAGSGVKQRRIERGGTDIEGIQGQEAGCNRTLSRTIMALS